MGVPLLLTDAQRQIVEAVAASEPFSWRTRYFDALSDALLALGSRQLTDEDVNRAVRRAVNMADGDWSDYDDCA